MLVTRHAWMAPRSAAGDITAPGNGMHSAPPDARVPNTPATELSNEMDDNSKNRS